MFAWKHGMGGFYGHGFCMGPDFGRSMSMTWPIPQLDEVEWLKRYKDGLELYKKDVEAKLKTVEERIQKLENKDK